MGIIISHDHVVSCEMVIGIMTLADSLELLATVSDLSKGFWMIRVIQ